MRIKDGFVLRTMLGDHVVLGEGLSQVDFNCLLSLNDTAAYLWEGVQGKDFTKEDLADLLVDKYGISREQAISDSESIANTWMEQGVLLP
ncbi:MAG: PqqD family protein [Bacteroidales bacterium]|nr:PqqD family protein [Bacteroidales bacterium]